MAKFTACINEFNGHIFKRLLFGIRNETLSEYKDTLFCAYDSSFNNEEVISYSSIANKASQRSNFFISKIRAS